MAWSAYRNAIQMAEDDFGVALKFNLRGFKVSPQDSIKFIFKTNKNDDPPLLEKEYTNIVNNVVYLKFTQADSLLFPPGSYLYSLDWYKDGVFQCNIIPSAPFKVVDKA